MLQNSGQKYLASVSSFISLKQNTYGNIIRFCKSKMRLSCFYTRSIWSLIRVCLFVGWPPERPHSIHPSKRYDGFLPGYIGSSFDGCKMLCWGGCLLALDESLNHWQNGSDPWDQCELTSSATCLSSLEKNSKWLPDCPLAEWLSGDEEGRVDINYGYTWECHELGLWSIIVVEPSWCILFMLANFHKNHRGNNSVPYPAYPIIHSEGSYIVLL